MFRIFPYTCGICISPFDECLFKTFAHFKIELFASLLLIYLSPLCILAIKPLSDLWLTNIFSHSVVKAVFSLC
jgi:hypothetical protein